MEEDIPPDKGDDPSTDRNGRNDDITVVAAATDEGVSAGAVGEYDESGPASTSEVPTVEEKDTISEEYSDGNEKANHAVAGHDSVICRVAGCNKAADSRMIPCNNCEKYTHFSCTQLPPYQISMFMTKGYRRYICEHCYVKQNGEVHSDYYEPTDESNTSVKQTQTASAWKAWDDLNMLYRKGESNLERLTNEKETAEKEMKATIDDLDNQLEAAKNELNRVNDSLTAQKNENHLVSQKLQAEKQECNTAIRKVTALEEDNQNLEHRLRVQGNILASERKKRSSITKESSDTEIKKVRTQLESMQTLLDEKEKEVLTLEAEKKTMCDKIAALTAENTKFREQDDNREKCSSVEIEGAQKLVDIEALLNERLDKIENNIDSIITKKLNESIKEVNNIGEKIDSAITNNKKTFAESVGGAKDPLTKAFLNSKNQEIVHQQERDRRSANLIIYRIKESSDGDQAEEDKAFVTSFLDKIGVAQCPKHIHRLGQKRDDKIRPVKLVMESEGEKDTIMARLGNLKNAEEVYRKVSVREDYTQEEREMVREMVQKAEAKNAAENTNEWKVRGTPKTGLKVVKITKRHQ